MRTIRHMWVGKLSCTCKQENYPEYMSKRNILHMWAREISCSCEQEVCIFWISMKLIYMSSKQNESYDTVWQDEELWSLTTPVIYHESCIHPLRSHALKALTKVKQVYLASYITHNITVDQAHQASGHTFTASYNASLSLLGIIQLQPHNTPQQPLVHTDITSTLISTWST